MLAILENNINSLHLNMNSICDKFESRTEHAINLYLTKRLSPRLLFELIILTIRTNCLHDLVMFQLDNQITIIFINTTANMVRTPMLNEKKITKEKFKVKILQWRHPDNITAG